MDEGGAQGNGGRIADANVELLGRGQNAVLRRGVCDGVADDFADLDAAGLVDEKHDPKKSALLIVAEEHQERRKGGETKNKENKLI